MVAKRGPKKRTRPASVEVAPLKSQNIMIGGHRTSIRLEPSMWDALGDIAQREGQTIDELCGAIDLRLEEQARRKGVERAEMSVTLTSAVRVLTTSYYRRAATEEGHARAGHGVGNPFLGTPFEAPVACDADSVGGGRNPASVEYRNPVYANDDASLFCAAVGVIEF